MKLQEKVNFIDNVGTSFTGIVVKANLDGTLDIKVKRRIAFEPQVFVRVPKEIKDQKNKPRPRYTEVSVKKEISKKKE